LQQQRDTLMKVLLVDDARSVVALMATRLVSFGHEVCTAANGQIALDKFKEDDFDLVLMDIEMPVMNGFEATNRIRAFEALRQWAWTPILFLTASDTQENLITAIEAGGDDFLSKTAPEAILQAKMKAMGRIATLRQRLATANQKLAEQASRDGLTGLCNRRYMDLRLDVAWADAIRLEQPLGLLMIDIDNFKKYNDHYGHPAGDTCLHAIAHAVEDVVRAANNSGYASNAFAARYGGEEFAVVLPGASAAAFEGIAASIIEAVQHCAITHTGNEPWGIATASIGGGYLPLVTGRIADLFRQADQRLYLAKGAGRNRATIADE
jgi:diguanylate cyclase (GGDEF)-like protein